MPQKIIDGGYNSYEIFGKEAETPISDVIEEFLSMSGIQYTSRKARTKNDFPDLEVTINGVRYALEHKAGVCNIKGARKNTAANDMGTLNAYPQKLQTYGDNIYCVFVKYTVLDDDTIRINDIYFDKIYVFVGRGAGFDNQLQYREKDGNLRPKKWTDMSEILHISIQLMNLERRLPQRNDIVQSE